jgi:hypothetical protein
MEHERIAATAKIERQECWNSGTCPDSIINVDLSTDDLHMFYF